MDGDGEAPGAYAGGRRQLRRAMAILGKKWHPLLLQTLLVEEQLGFNDIKTRLDGISDKVLSESLDELQDDGLILREVIDDKPVRVQYSLTSAGADLEPVFTRLQQWSHEHLDDSE